MEIAVDVPLIRTAANIGRRVFWQASHPLDVGNEMAAFGCAIPPGAFPIRAIAKAIHLIIRADVLSYLRMGEAPFFWERARPCASGEVGIPCDTERAVSIPTLVSSEPFSRS